MTPAGAPGGGALSRVQALIELRRFPEALELLARSAEGQTYEGQCLRARAELGRGDARACLHAAEAALAANPAGDWPQRLRAIALSRLRRHREALDAARAALEVVPGSYAGHLVLAEVALPARKPKLAAAEAQAALAVSPGEARPYLLLARASRQLRKLSDAERYAHQAIEREPTDAEAFAELGIVLRARNQRRAAMDALDTAIKLDPSWERARQIQHATVRAMVSPRLALLFALIAIPSAAGLGDPDPHSRRAALVLFVSTGSVALGSLLYWLWAMAHHQLPETASVVIAEHRRQARQRRATARVAPALAAAAVLILGIALFGYLSDPSQWAAAGWVVAVLTAGALGGCAWYLRTWWGARRRLVRGTE